jgi:D-3-phosphoglycerate dehydrogenase
VKTGTVVVAARSFGRIEPEGADMLRRAGLTIRHLPGKRSTHEELAELMQDADTVAVVAGAEPITAEMINASPNLQVIAMYGVGLDHIDQDSAQLHDVSVKAVPGGNADAVADLTFGLMLAVARRIAEADAAVRCGEWAKSHGHSVCNKVLGIVGFGAIGQAVARRALGFNMKTFAYDVYRNDEAAAELNASYVELDELLRQSDFVTLHVPLTAHTEGLISARELQLMKPTAILINVSRGGVVNESDLHQALVDGLIGGAGIDVFTEEPLSANHVLKDAPNCVLTPHIGGRARETIRYIGVETAKNVLQALE